MKPEFMFDGECLHIRIHVEGEWEVAAAKLMEQYHQAKVSLDYGSRGIYDGYSNRDRDPQAVDIFLRKIPAIPEPETPL